MASAATVTIIDLPRVRVPMDPALAELQASTSKLLREVHGAKIDLINSRDSKADVSAGLLAISAFVRENGHTVRYFDLSKGLDNEIAASIADSGFVGFSPMTPTF